MDLEDGGVGWTMESSGYEIHQHRSAAESIDQQEAKDQRLGGRNEMESFGGVETVTMRRPVVGFLFRRVGEEAHASLAVEPIFTRLRAGNGCGFFLYVEDIMQGLGGIQYESTKIDVMDCKRIVESLRDEVLVVQQRSGRIEEATKKMNAFDHHSCVTVVKVVGVGVLVVLAAILCVNVMV
nr:uncharacterized protein LOC109147908 [Ipomoea batatas]